MEFCLLIKVAKSKMNRRDDYNSKTTTLALHSLNYLPEQCQHEATVYMKRQRSDCSYGPVIGK